MQMLLEFKQCLQSAEKYILQLILLLVYFLDSFRILTDLDLSDLSAFITDPLAALYFLTHLQTVEKGIDYYHK